MSALFSKIYVAKTFFDFDEHTSSQIAGAARASSMPICWLCVREPLGSKANGLYVVGSICDVQRLSAPRTR